MPLAGIHDGLQLEPAEFALIYEILEVQVVGDVRRFDCSQGGCFHGRVWVWPPIGKFAGSVIGEDLPCLVFLLFRRLLIPLAVWTVISI